MTSQSALCIAPVEEVLKDIRLGRMVVLVDDADRENEGDLVVATERVTAESVAFMMKFGRGLICASVPEEVASRLHLPLQVHENKSPFRTAFTVSVDHVDVVQNGASAAARAYTMQKLAEATARASDFVSPGHVFPLIANPEGVLGRRGQTEGSLELSRMAGLFPSGVICEVLAADGSTAKGDVLEKFAQAHGIKVTSVEAVIRYRIGGEVIVREVARSTLDTAWGRFSVIVYLDDVERKEHLALFLGDVRGAGAPLVRIHSECLTGDVFGSRRCDCGEQLSRSLEAIAREGSGALIYLRQEGRGIGLLNKLRAYELQDVGHDTVEANVRLGFKPDLRDYSVAARILEALGCRRIRLLTNNPEKITAMNSRGIEVSERIPLVVEPDEYSRSYLETKRTKLGHLL